MRSKISPDSGSKVCKLENIYYMGQMDMKILWYGTIESNQYIRIILAQSNATGSYRTFPTHTVRA
jgi:hypothetical protein